ncbi:MAG: hypothetical protein SFU98_07315 [Leptospiraceae bacterium]|nr:hypothetical protein [Leptospiraceae bacterium]
MRKKLYEKWGQPSCLVDVTILKEKSSVSVNFEIINSSSYYNLYIIGYEINLLLFDKEIFQRTYFDSCEIKKGSSSTIYKNVLLYEDEIIRIQNDLKQGRNLFFKVSGNIFYQNFYKEIKSFKFSSIAKETINLETLLSKKNQKR